MATNDWQEDRQSLSCPPSFHTARRSLSLSGSTAFVFANHTGTRKSRHDVPVSLRMASLVGQDSVGSRDLSKDSGSARDLWNATGSRAPKPDVDSDDDEDEPDRQSLVLSHGLLSLIHPQKFVDPEFIPGSPQRENHTLFLPSPPKSWAIKEDKDDEKTRELERRSEPCLVSQHESARLVQEPDRPIHSKRKRRNKRDEVIPFVAPVFTHGNITKLQKAFGLTVQDLQLAETLQNSQRRANSAMPPRADVAAREGVLLADQQKPRRQRRKTIKQSWEKAMKNLGITQGQIDLHQHSIRTKGEHEAFVAKRTQVDKVRSLQKAAKILGVA